MSSERFNEADLAKFKQVQRLAYDVLLQVEAELRVGMTEKDAAERIEQRLRERGVDRFFHRGFAWFGDRAAFRGFVKPQGSALGSIANPAMAHFGRQFRPTDRPLREGDSVILDVAPVVDDVAVDIGYVCALVPDRALHEARMALAPHRELILRMVRARASQASIYRAVDELLEQQGYENVHATYPGGVIAHKVGKVPFAGLRLPSIQGFSPQAIAYLGGHLVREAFDAARHKTPLWGHAGDSPCEPGLWAVEPHIGKGDVGAKFEEILVVTEDNAYWLDDDLPHVRYWKAHGVSPERAVVEAGR